MNNSIPFPFDNEQLVRSIGSVQGIGRFIGDPFKIEFQYPGGYHGQCDQKAYGHCKIQTSQIEGFIPGVQEYDGSGKNADHCGQ